MTDIVSVIGVWRCAACLFSAVSQAEFQVVANGSYAHCKNCTLEVTADAAYCKGCVTCTECDEIAQKCESHAGQLSCYDCGDPIATGETAYCGDCGGHDYCHDECPSGESYCEMCGEEANWILCQSHYDEQMGETSHCADCGKDDAIVYCRECANDFWFAGAAPLAVVDAESGAITVDGTEVHWN